MSTPAAPGSFLRPSSTSSSGGFGHKQRGPARPIPRVRPHRSTSPRGCATSGALHPDRADRRPYDRRREARMKRPIGDAPDPGFAPARVERIPRADGGFVLRSPTPLAPHARCLGEWLLEWAERTPTRTFLAERTGNSWRVVTYADALHAARTLGSGLIERGLSEERPLVILSDNSVDHALLAIAAQFVGVPYAPISPAYSLLSSDHAKLRAIFALL